MLLFSYLTLTLVIVGDHMIINCTETQLNWWQVVFISSQVKEFGEWDMKHISHPVSHIGLKVWD